MEKFFTRSQQKKWKKLLLFFVSMAAVLTESVSAQVNINATTYTFSRNGFAPTTLSSPVTLIGPNADNVASAVTDIGFTFWFAGTPYTRFSVSENGLMTLGNTQISGSDVANNLASATTLPKIAPYWDDLATGTNGSVVYQVTGTAPNRILIVNWNVTVPKNAGGTANSIIQVQLTESTGTITFTYGTPAVPANANMYSVGIGASSNDFASVTPTSATAATCAYGVANNSVTISPGVYTRYNFFPDRTAPAVSAQTIPNSFGIGNRSLTKTISDAKTGVPVSGNFVPRIYFKKSTDASYVSSPGILASGTGASGTWNFTIDHSIIPGGVAEGDIMNYFVIAQDQSTTMGTPNIASVPAGAVATDVNTITTPPAPSTYLIGTSFTDTVKVGAGGNFSSLSLSGGLFEAIGAGRLTGNLVVKIISDLASESANIPLNAWNEAAGGPFNVKIIPEGNRTISGSLKFSGVKGLTVDGLNDGANSLTMGSVTFSFGASNNTITRTTLDGVSFNDASGTFPVNCSNNTISYCTVNGMLYFGSWVSASGLNNVIDHNTIRNFSQYGIHIDRGYRNFTISNNEFYQTGTGNYSTAIYIYNEAGTTNIFNNRIHDIRSGTGLGVWTAGIYYRFGLATDVLNIYNNLIYLDAVTTNTASYLLHGLQMEGAGTSNIYYNSIYIGGSGVTSGNSAALYKTGGTVNFRNNAVFNARSCTAPNQYAKNYAIRLLNLNGFNSDNNLLYANGVSGFLGYVGPVNGMGGIDYTNLADWRNATGKDALSVSADPLFSSATDLVPLAGTPLAGVAAPIAGYTTDITGAARNALIPTAGAYETAPPAIIAGNSISFVNGISGTVCAAVPEYNTAVLNAPAGTVFVKVEFASYGTPAGTCPDFTIGTCHAPSSRAITEGYLLGNNSASIQAGNWIFGEPCPNTAKQLYIAASYSEPICTGSLPGTISGTTPTGGTGSFTYLWQSSITGADGFTPAPGTNNTRDYTPATALSQDTWFRRIVISGPVKDTSVMVLVKIASPASVGVSIAASSTEVYAGQTVDFTATPVNGGAVPAYQWKVNNVNAGTNSEVFTYAPANNDVVTCVMTSSASCVSNNPATSNAITLRVLATGNNIDWVNGTNGIVCVTAAEYTAAILTAPAGTVFTKVNFASYGTPAGTCPDFTVGGCHAPASRSIVESYLLGKTSASIQAGNWIFGEPCPNTAKQLYIAASYNQPVCLGSLPGTITGSVVYGTPSYLWQSSTTGLEGFIAADGINNTRDYTPGAIYQTTWFRRLVTTAGVTDTSNLILITVNPVVNVSVSIAASATEVNAGQSVVFTATPVNGGNTPVYQWKVNGVNSGSNSAQFTHVPLNNDLITVELTSGEVCASGNPAVSNAVVMRVNSISGNTITYVNGISGTICATAPEYNFATLSAPVGTVFTSVDFASYGTPSGTCPDFVMGGCHAASSQSVAESYLLGNNAASIPAGNWIFGEPCPNTLKQLYIKATYMEPVCSGSLPGTITGSLPTASGTIAYLWESSTVSATSGFSPAAGINDAQDYTPEALNQTTWFRRTVTSDGFSNTSAAVGIYVANCQPQLKSTGAAEKADLLNESMISVYPVPNEGHFNVTIDSRDESYIDIMLYNSLGETILSMKNVYVRGRTVIPFNVESSPEGIYLLRIINGNDQVTRKIVIEK